MIRASSMVLLSVASLAAVAVLRSGAGAQAPQEAQPEREKPHAKMQCPMMSGLKGIDLFVDSPAVLQAEAKDLKLTEQQLERLKEIEQSARRQARQLLTEEQRKQLLDRPEGPLSLMELSMSRMKEKRHMPDGEKSGQMCPMCMKMMQMMKMKQGEEHHPPKKEDQTQKQ